MTKNTSRWFIIFATTALLVTLVILALVVMQVIWNNRTPLASLTEVSNGYPGPTEELPATSTREPDVSATLAWLQTRQPIPTTSYPTGIFTEGLAEYSKMGFDIKNGWRGELDGYPIRAAVGSLVSDSLQGVILVAWDLPGTPNAGVYETTRKAGYLEIASEQNKRLILQAEDGSIFYFDLPGQRFVASLDESVPTVTPRPSLTPTVPAEVGATGYPAYSTP
jgi:hypothetical protein